MDAFDIHENALRSDEGGQVVADAAGIGSGIVAAVADEDILRKKCL
jgi:hypothetical protein